MTTGGSDDKNESKTQDATAFQQEMVGMGARVPPGRMGNAKDLASVSYDTFESEIDTLPSRMMGPY